MLAVLPGGYVQLEGPIDNKFGISDLTTPKISDYLGLGPYYLHSDPYAPPSFRITKKSIRNLSTIDIFDAFPLGLRSALYSPRLRGGLCNTAT